jgi:hypothetical protein
MATTDTSAASETHSVIASGFGLSDPSTPLLVFGFSLSCPFTPRPAFEFCLSDPSTPLRASRSGLSDPFTPLLVSFLKFVRPCLVSIPGPLLRLLAFLQYCSSSFRVLYLYGDSSVRWYQDSFT